MICRRKVHGTDGKIAKARAGARRSQGYHFVGVEKKRGSTIQEHAKMVISSDVQRSCCMWIEGVMLFHVFSH